MIRGGSSYHQLHQQVNYRGGADRPDRVAPPLVNGSKSSRPTTPNSKSKRNGGSLRRILDVNYGTFFSNKSAQFFYFWARTRLVQRAIMVLSALWIILIFYKSMLIVELMRHDVNVNKETVEALLPKGMGLPKLIKNNYFKNTMPPSSTPSNPDYPASPSSFPPPLSSQPESQSQSDQQSTTIDYFKKHFHNLVLPTPRLRTSRDHQNVLLDNMNRFSWETTSDESTAKFDDNEHQSWKSLSANHWLTLFSYYNVSLHNRYVAILPQINLFR